MAQADVAPLRRVVGWLEVARKPADVPITMEVFECGHMEPFYPPCPNHHHAQRHRCLQCMLGEPPKVDVQRVTWRNLEGGEA